MVSFSTRRIPTLGNRGYWRVISMVWGFVVSLLWIGFFAGRLVAYLLDFCF